MSPPERAVTAPPRGDLMATSAALVALVAWDLSGADLALTRLWGNTEGFAWRHAFLTETVLHSGGRWLAGLCLAWLVWDAWRARIPGPPRAVRWRGVGLVLAGLLLVPVIKRFSQTSCPWSMAEFGGVAAYVSHWQIGASDGGPGGCFPSGHAVGAFAFFGSYVTWRHWRPRLARAMLWATLAIGALFAWAQLARGAHHLSHSLWSAWLCWALAVAAAPRPRASAGAFHARVALTAPRRLAGRS